MKQFSAVIVNYRTPDLTIEAIRSLASDVAGRQDRAVIVVDNFSEDDSADKIQAAISENGWDKWARLVPSPVNGGFSAGNNLGMASQEAEFYLLLNSDARVTPGAVDRMIAEMQGDRDIGLSGPRLQWQDGEPQVSCFRNRTPISEFLSAAETGPIDRLFKSFVVARGLPDETRSTDWISFACVMVRGETLNRIGGMDEGYFLYFEDIDYCRKARKAGWKVVHIPEARAIHLRGGSASLKKDTTARRRLPRYIYESRARYFAKFYGGLFGILLGNAMWMSGRLISFLRERLGSKQPHTCDRQMTDNWINWSNPMRTSSYTPWISKK